MKSRALWQISVSIGRDAEDAVADLVQRVFELTPSIYRREKDGATFVTVYSSKKHPQDRRALDNLAVGLERIAQCGLDVYPGTVTIKRIKQQDWAEAWKHHFKLIELGRSLLIKPSWSRRRPRKGQAVVVLDPGLSFGTGQHPTTDFCLAQLVAARHIDTAQSFLDVGTGSGILALAAAKLGYHPVYGFDADPKAVRVARENARKNRVLHRIRLVHADLTRLPISSKFKYHIVCANLTSDLLIAQRPRILNRMRPDGILVVSGVLRIEFEHVRKCYCESGMRLRLARTLKEWHSGVFAFDHKLSAFHSRNQKSAKNF